jgi:hypothetical protein
MPNSDRERIYHRLRYAVGDQRDLPPLPPYPTKPPLSREEKIERLKTLMTAMRSEVYVIPKSDSEADPNSAWTDHLKEILREKGLKDMLYAPGTPVGDAVKAAWAAGNDGLPPSGPMTPRWKPSRMNFSPSMRALRQPSAALPTPAP